MPAVEKGLRVLKRAEEGFIGILIIAATIILFANVVLRYGFSANVSWANELVRYLMIWIAFLGMGVCYRKGIHVGIDVLLDYVPKKAAKAIQLFVNVLSILFLAFLGWYGAQMVQFSMDSNQITPSLQIGIYWVYLVIPIGCLISIIHIIGLSIRMWKQDETQEMNHMSEEPQN
ncbi:TRAP transporter small permease [Alkalicoccus urumqiensis]|uniref:TRAP transporter small permease n=2 Tax=Alkalicoccus urumqiensis TaxID=1548213 RepID=A0A2P6MLX1_ALKUR|nr:TRAP transporter small permease [Alkalicoccus urumqiensis]